MLGLLFRSPQRRATSSGSISLNSPFVPSQAMQFRLARSDSSSSRNCHSWICPLPARPGPGKVKAPSQGTRSRAGCAPVFSTPRYFAPPALDPGFRCNSLHLPCSGDTEGGNKVTSPLQHPYPILHPKEEEERTSLHLWTGVGVVRGQCRLQWVWIQGRHVPPTLIRTPLKMNICSFALV